MEGHARGSGRLAMRGTVVALVLSLGLVPSFAEVPEPVYAPAPSLTWSLVPDGLAAGSARNWATGLSGAGVVAGLGWTLWEGWSMARPFMDILASSDLSKADRTGGAIASSPGFQAHLFGFGFAIVATGVAANLLNALLHGGDIPGRTAAPESAAVP